MTSSNDIHHRCSLRLKDFDYASAGAYFITICTYQRACVFGQIETSTVQLSYAGKMIESVWKEIPTHYASVELDEFVVMPNHIHGIIVISEAHVGAKFIAPKSRHDSIDQGAINRAPMVGEIVRAFKARCTHAIHQGQSAQDISVWQRNYYEHIIRNEKELTAIREYIANNPLQWDLDANNPLANNTGGADVWEA